MDSCCCCCCRVGPTTSWHLPCLQHRGSRSLFHGICTSIAAADIARCHPEALPITNEFQIFQAHSHVSYRYMAAPPMSEPTPAAIRSRLLGFGQPCRPHTEINKGSAHNPRGHLQAASHKQCAVSFIKHQPPSADLPASCWDRCYMERGCRCCQGSCYVWMLVLTCSIIASGRS